MKYLKNFEGLIKSTDTRAVNHIMNPLADELVNFLNKLGELLGYSDWTVKKYYTDDSIKVVYYAYTKYRKKIDLFMFRILNLPYDENKFSLFIESETRWTFEDSEKRRIELSREIRDMMRKYVSESDYLFRAGRNEFSVDDMNDIINEFKKIEAKLQIEIDTNKYNL